jgi:hypothetical protein
MRLLSAQMNALSLSKGLFVSANSRAELLYACSIDPILSQVEYNYKGLTSNGCNNQL